MDLHRLRGKRNLGALECLEKQSFEDANIG